MGGGLLSIGAAVSVIATSRSPAPPPTRVITCNRGAALGHLPPNVCKQKQGAVEANMCEAGGSGRVKKFAPTKKTAPASKGRFLFKRLRAAPVSPSACRARYAH